MKKANHGKWPVPCRYSKRAPRIAICDAGKHRFLTGNVHMNPTKDTGKSSAPTTHGSVTWWSASHDATWQKAQKDMVTGWKKSEIQGVHLDSSIAESALAFGHGARGNYAKMGDWTDELEGKLRADWKTSKATEQNWGKVRDAVKYGFSHSARA